MADPTIIRFPPAPDVPFVGSPEIFFNYDSRSQAANAGQSLVRGYLPFNIGHMPADKLPALFMSDGTTPSGMVLQFDKLATDTPDGSTVGMSFRGYIPETISALNGFKSYKWGMVTATRNTTPKVTIASITANTNLIVKLHGGDFNAETYSVSLNDILTNFPGGLAPQNYSRSVLGGWEITEQGPVCTTIHAWRFIKRDSDGATHRWVRVDFNWTFLSADAGNIQSFGTVRYKNANIKGPVAGATAGVVPTGTAAYQNNTYSYPYWYSCITELYNGSTLVTAPDFIGAAGGPTDSYTNTVSASSLTVANGSFTAGTNLAYSFCYRVSSDGTLPGGLTANTNYWANGGTLYMSRNDMADGINPVNITSVGSGNITFTVMMVIAAGAGFVLRTTDGSEEPIWFGTAARPTKVDRARDPNYLLRGARATFPRDPTVVVTSQPSDVGFTYTKIGAPPGVPWDLNTTGDGRNDLRIGEMDVLNTISIYLNQNAEIARQSRSLAYCWADYQAHWLDETSGRRPVANGINYPNMGVSLGADFNLLVSQACGGFIAGRSNGWTFRYLSMVDGSHMPTFGKNPFLRYGDDIFLEMVFDQVGSLSLAYARDITAPSGTTYRSCFNNTSDQARAPGWATHIGLFARKFAPDQHPESQHYRDCIKNSAKCYADFAQNNPTNAKAIGVVIPQMFYQSSSNARQNWMNHIYNGSVLMAYWMGMDQDWRTGVDLVGYISFCDMYLAEKGGHMYEAAGANIYQTSNETVAGCYPNLTAMWAACKNQRTQAPMTYPDIWAGALGDSVQSEYPDKFPFSGAASSGTDVTDWPSFVLMTFEMADVCGIPNARLVRERYRARINRNGGFVPGPYRQNAPMSWAP